MANRSQMAKLLKLKRRGKSKRFSQQVINTGRGPDPERMQTYYHRVSAKSYSSVLPPTKGMTEPMKEVHDALSRLRGAVPDTNRITLIENHTGSLMLFFSEGKQWFFIDCDYDTRVFRRSCDYNKKETALSRLKCKRVGWVETISLPTK